MRFAVILLILVGLSMAFTIRPNALDIHDTGSESLDKLDVGMIIDCDTKDLTVEVAAQTSEEPVVGAKTYLFYTDYTYQPLPGSGTTDSEGRTTMSVPGTIRFLTALFILRVDHADYQSREIEFTYQKCFEEPPSEGPGEEEPEEPPEIPELQPLSMDITNTCSGTTVIGNVITVTSSGEAVENAYIDVEDIDPLRKVASGYTDAQGQFSFTGCGDEYSIRASAGGYESKTMNVTLTGCNECVEIVEEPEEEIPPPATEEPEEAPEEPTEGPLPDDEPLGPEPSTGCPLGVVLLSLSLVFAIKY